MHLILIIFGIIILFGIGVGFGYIITDEDSKLRTYLPWVFGIILGLCGSIIAYFFYNFHTVKDLKIITDGLNVNDGLALHNYLHSQGA